MPGPPIAGELPELEDFLRAPIGIIGAFFVVWFLNMALVGWLANRKGRDGGLWVLIALFTGPIALVAILLVGRRERGPDADFEELAAATTPRIRLEDDWQIELDVEGRPARLRGEVSARIKGQPSFRLARSTEWQWSDGTPMTDEERAQLLREVPRIGKRDGWVLTLDAEDARAG